jgi:hypothetical protein
MCRRMNFGGLDLRQAHSQMHRALQTGNAHLDWFHQLLNSHATLCRLTRR